MRGAAWKEPLAIGARPKRVSRAARNRFREYASIDARATDDEVSDGVNALLAGLEPDMWINDVNYPDQLSAFIRFELDVAIAVNVAAKRQMVALLRGDCVVTLLDAAAAEKNLRVGRWVEVPQPLAPEAGPGHDDVLVKRRLRPKPEAVREIAAGCDVSPAALALVTNDSPARDSVEHHRSVNGSHEPALLPPGTRVELADRSELHVGVDLDVAALAVELTEALIAAGAARRVMASAIESHGAATERVVAARDALARATRYTED